MLGAVTSQAGVLQFGQLLGSGGASAVVLFPDVCGLTLAMTEARYSLTADIDAYSLSATIDGYAVTGCHDE